MITRPEENTADCTLTAKREILALLGELRSRRSLLTLEAADPTQQPLPAPLRTAILGVDDAAGRFSLDLGGWTAGTGAWQERAVSVEALLDHIPVRFTVAGGQVLGESGAQYLSLPLPTDITRLQRRRAYRVEAPIIDAVYCRVRLNPDATENTLFRVHDLSPVGLALVLPADCDPSPGTLWRKCRIDLPSTGVIHCGLEIIDRREQAIAAGRLRLAGCRFVDLPGPDDTVISRYLIDLQRRRNARL